MTEEIDRSYESRRSAPGWMIAAVAVLGVVALVGLVMAHNASTQAQEIQQSLETKVKAVQADFASQVATSSSIRHRPTRPTPGCRAT